MSVREFFAVLLVASTFGLLGLSSQLPDCPTEDSSGCYWDATEHGNGQGRSFIAPQGQR